MADRLWDWAVRAYAAPQVEPLCLSLQDHPGQSVCLRLWAGWAAASGRWPDAAGLAEAVVLARHWEREVVGPLRAARRGLNSAPGLAEDVRQALRARVQADELAAERALLEALEALAPLVGEPGVQPLAALAAASLALGPAAPGKALESLADAFPRG